MRKIERAMVAAVASQQPWSQDNTQVDVHNGVTRVYLHGNLIAEGQGGSLAINWPVVDRWPTNTTNSRLRALGFRVGRKDGETIEYDANWKAIVR